MSSLTEKMLFSFEMMKIYLFGMFENIIGDSFAEVGYELSSSSIIIKVYLFKLRKSFFDKSIINQEILNLKKLYNQDFKLKYILLDEQEQKYFPKYYFLLFKNKFERSNVPPFSTINKINLSLPSKVSGIYICVKGKRGFRKDRKNFEIGSVSKHTYKKDLLAYQGIIQSIKGVTGVFIKIKYKDQKVVKEYQI